jgi:N4-(beta-N-acetylglucosaminyl)-L-asparaginase
MGTRREFLNTAGMTTAAIAAAGSLARSSIASAAGAPAGVTGSNAPQPASSFAGDAHRGPCVIASGNGLRCVDRGMELLREGYDPADCVVQGVRIIEDDPSDQSVGYGGLPNEEGVVELDASVMHGPTHKSGAVASIRNIKNPAMVALLVLRRTNHCLLVGDGALRFARQMGFPEENLLTEDSRRAWLKWKANAGTTDFWLDDDQRDPAAGKVWTDDGPARLSLIDPSAVMHLTGTVHCSAVTSAGDIASCTTTSGLSWKIPGRVGDSPIIGAGNYCDNAVGAAGCTGRGESAIVNLSAYTMVMLMERGMTPREACLEAAKRMADRTKEKRLRGPDGRPNFNVSFYAVRKDGAYGGASLAEGGSMAVHDGTTSRVFPTEYLYPKS